MEESVADVLSEFQRNNRWIIDNYCNLKKQYNNRWVAVLNNAVVDHDSELKKLVKRLKTQHSKDYRQIAVEYITSEESELTLEQNENFADSPF
jgi:hypothetical protein